MKPKNNYCANCEEIVTFRRGKCAQCGGKYDDVVPASYREELKMDKPNNMQDDLTPTLEGKITLDQIIKKYSFAPCERLAHNTPYPCFWEREIYSADDYAVVLQQLKDTNIVRVTIIELCEEPMDGIDVMETDDMNKIDAWMHLITT